MTAAVSSMEQLADVLHGLKVRGAFGVTGSGPSLQLITALESRGVPFHGACHESAAAMMAGAFGRIGSSLGCSISIKGPGLANMLPGILSNAYEQLPVLSISEAYPTGSDARAHKRLDHGAALDGCVKGYTGLEDAGRLSALVALARDEVPGPIHLDLAQQSGVQRRRRTWSRSSVPLQEALAAIARSSRPVVIAGSLATRRAWGRELARLKVPVFTTVAAKGLVDERTAYAAGVFTGDGKARSPEVQVLSRADLVVGLGLRNLEILTPRTFGVPNALFRVVGTGWGLPSDAVVSGLNDEAFGPVLAALAKFDWGSEWVGGARANVIRYLTEADWLPGTALQCLRERVDESARLAVDTGLFCTVAEHLWWTSDPSRFVASANGRFMGTGIPMALGAGLADPTTPVICAVGDGGIRVAVGELKVAIERRLPLLLLLLSDGRYGSVAGAPSARGLSHTATTIVRPSWAAAMSALGLPASEARNVAEFERAISRWSPVEGPAFIEAVFDSTLYERMTEDVR